jgi:F0F1-type ATP synthase assembly protein I
MSQPATSETAPAASDPIESTLERILTRKRERHERGEQYRTYLRWMGRGLEIPVSVIVGLLLGRVIGDFVGFKAEGTWIGLFFGIVTAVRSMVRITRAYQREEGGDEPS